MKKRLLIEFIGTFFLVLTVALTGNPLAIGGVLIALVYLGGYISGAHYNPAVTLALMVNKKITTQEAKLYILTQFIAAIIASISYLIIANKVFVPTIGAEVGILAAALAEILFTFLLATVVLHVAATDKTKGNHYYGLAIGLTVMAGAFAVGPISGAVFNPAVGVGPLIFDVMHLGSHLTSILLYLLAPLTGGYLAGIFYKSLNK